MENWYLTENTDEHRDFNDDYDDDLLPLMYTNETLMIILPQKTQKTQIVIRAGGSLIEDGAGNVVSQRFRHLQMNATWK